MEPASSQPPSGSAPSCQRSKACQHMCIMHVYMAVYMTVRAHDARDHNALETHAVIGCTCPATQQHHSRPGPAHRLAGCSMPARTACQGRAVLCAKASMRRTLRMRGTPAPFQVPRYTTPWFLAAAPPISLLCRCGPSSHWPLLPLGPLVKANVRCWRNDTGQVR